MRRVTLDCKIREIDDMLPELSSLHKQLKSRAAHSYEPTYDSKVKAAVVKTDQLVKGKIPRFIELLTLLGDGQGKYFY